MLKISSLFLKNNIGKYKSIFISIVIFIFTINIVSIFLVGMSSGLNEQVIENDNLNIFELYPDENQNSLTSKELNSLNSVEGVLSAYYTECITIECVDTDTNMSGYNFSVFKLDSQYLKYYGLPETNSKTYFYGNFLNLSGLDKGENYRALKNENNGSSDIDFHMTNIISIPDNLLRLIPGDVSFTDPETFDLLLKNCDSWYISEDSYSKRLAEIATVHLIVPDVTKQNQVAKTIRDEYPNMKVYYVLDNAEKLPTYVDTFIKIGFVLLVILLIFYFISIRNNISHTLNFRVNVIKLFNALGVEPSNIVKCFYYEFIILSLFSWIIQFILTIFAVFIAAIFLNIEVYLDAVKIVLLGNIVLLFLSIGIESYFVIKRNVMKILELSDRS